MRIHLFSPWRFVLVSIGFLHLSRSRFERRQPSVSPESVPCLCYATSAFEDLQKRRPLMQGSRVAGANERLLSFVGGGSLVSVDREATLCVVQHRPSSQKRQYCGVL